MAILFIESSWDLASAIEGLLEYCLQHVGLWSSTTPWFCTSSLCDQSLSAALSPGFWCRLRRRHSVSTTWDFLSLNLYRWLGFRTFSTVDQLRLGCEFPSEGWPGPQFLLCGFSAIWLVDVVSLKYHLDSFLFCFGAFFCLRFLNFPNLWWLKNQNFFPWNLMEKITLAGNFKFVSFYKDKIFGDILMVLMPNPLPQKSHRKLPNWLSGRLIAPPFYIFRVLITEGF